MRYLCGGPARALGGYGSKVGNQAQADFSIIFGQEIREIWDGRTLAGRCTANCLHFARLLGENSQLGLRQPAAAIARPSAISVICGIVALYYVGRCKG